MIIQEDSWFKRHIETKVNALMSDVYGCRFYAHLHSVNLLLGTFEVRGITVTGNMNYDWSWQAERSFVSWSWFDLAWYGSCGMHIILEKLTCNSSITFSGTKDAISIAQHLVLLTTPADFDVPCEIASFAIRNGTLFLYDTTKTHDRGYVVGCSFSSDAHVTHEAFWSSLRIANGYLSKEGVRLVDGFEGTGFCYAPSIERKNAGLDADHSTLTARCLFSRLPQEIQEVGLSIEWQGTRGSCSLRNEDQSLNLFASIEDYNQVSGFIDVPVVYPFSLLTTDDQLNIVGDLSLSFFADLHNFDTSFFVDYSVDNLHYYGTKLPDLSGKVVRKVGYGLTGSLELLGPEGQVALGNWKFADKTSYFTCNLETISEYELPGPYNLIGGKLKLYGDISPCINISGNLSGTVKERSSREQFPIKSLFSINPQQLFISAYDDNNSKSCDVMCGFKPQLYFDLIRYREGDTVLVDIEGASNGEFKGSLAYSIVRRLITLSGMDFAGDGTVNLDGHYSKNKFTALLSMEDGTIRLPSTYTIVKGGRVTLQGDFTTRKFTCTELQAELYKGSVSASKVTVWFDENWRVSFFHCPLLLNDCFLSWKKELFAQLSGSLLAKYSFVKNKTDLLSVEGQLVLDKSHMRGNVLSAEFQRDLLGPGTDSVLSPARNLGRSGRGQKDTDYILDIGLITRTPIEVKTPFLDASAKCAIKLGGTLHDPLVTGSINFLDGALAFPYKPLFITRGKITFVPNRPDDPLIDLVARNTIKKYAVELAIVGSVQAPKITFSSSPKLEREQIITLLLGGSEDGSLYLIMPQVITNTLEHLMFGSAEASSRVQKYLKSLFQPLKSVRIVPHFSDQSGRGGVRGSVAVEVGDRLQATFAKNFSLSEDAAFEVDYLVSDDTSVRLIKDERGDIGLEGEMRWKF